MSNERCPVPLEQQPVNEYNNLLQSWLFSWVNLDAREYAVRLCIVGAVITVVIGWPVASLTFNSKDDTLACILSSLAAGQAAAALTTIRMYLGWSFVGSRLFSATVEYEETGWYDGQVWVKTPELLTRDRLLATYKVKPILNRLKKTMVALALSLSISTFFVVYISSIQPLTQTVSFSDTSPPVTLTAYSQQSTDVFEPSIIDGDEALNDDAMDGLSNIPAHSLSSY